MTTSTPRPKTPEPAYTPYGAARELLHCQAPEVLISGPAGTGKSVACLFKIHLIAESKPKFRGLILRKTRESLSESALASFERFVLPADHPARRGPQRRMRSVYRYPNGSELVIGGLDKPGKIMSTEFDLAYIQEAIEVDEHSWEHVTTRLRNNSISFQQLLADTNPDTPHHWLKRRCEAGRTRLLESRHQDNPLLFDREAGDWTDAGKVYIERLDNLTGPRKQRLRHGKWVQAEGLVYDGWDRSVHLVDRSRIPAEWPRFWAIDFGYTNAFVWQCWALDPDGRLHRYREIYRTQRLVEDHCKDILALTQNDPKPRAIVCDHDAEGRATLERHLGMATVKARKEVQAGIQAVAARLKPAKDGKPRLFLCRDSIKSRDPALLESKLPSCTEEEFDSYVWDENRKLGEQPVKAGDHGLDALRYMVAHLDLAARSPGTVHVMTHSVGPRLGDGGKREPALRIAITDKETLARWDVNDEHPALLIHFAAPDGSTDAPAHKIANLLGTCAATFADICPTDYTDEEWEAPIPPWGRPGRELMIDGDRDVRPMHRFLTEARDVPPRLIVLCGQEARDRRPETVALLFADKLGIARNESIFKPADPDWSCDRKSRPPNRYLGDCIRHHFYGWLAPRR